MGTPDFAVPCLDVLYRKTDVALVITQSDKPRGRGQKIKYTSVKIKALDYGLNVRQPEKIRRNKELINMIKDINPDIIVVVAYGKILPKSILDIPKYGCINIHASLLPNLRGAAPINWAIINGFNETGVTSMLLDEGMDTGDIIFQSSVKITDEDTYEILYKKLMALGAEVLKKTLDEIENINSLRRKQDESQASYARMLDKETGHINWNVDSKDVYNLIRGTVPWPGAFALYESISMKILKSEIIENGINGVPGEIIKANAKDGIIVQCKNGQIKLVEIQMPNSKRMSSNAYLLGHDIKVGEILK